MGGEREVKAPQSTSTKDQSGQKLGDLRIHENSGEVHFHDDVRQMKVAIPSGEWYAAWSKLSTGVTKKFSFFDPKTSFELKVKMVKKKNTGGKKQFEAKVCLEPVSRGEVYDILNQFTTKR